MICSNGIRCGGFEVPQTRDLVREALECAAVEVFDALLGARLEPAAQDYAMLEFTALWVFLATCAG